MPITITNRDSVRPTTKQGIKYKPNSAKVAMMNPGPVRVSTTGASASGNPLCEPTAVRTGYFGYNVRSYTPAAPNSEAYSIVSGCIVEGFAGVSPGLDVFVDPTARPAPGTDEGTFSGLTQTVPAGGAGERIGVGTTPEKIYFFDN